MIVIGGDNETDAVYAEMFGCQVGSLPMKYLGTPISYSTLKNIELDFLDAKMIKKTRCLDSLCSFI